MNYDPVTQRAKETLDTEMGRLANTVTATLLVLDSEILKYVVVFSLKNVKISNGFTFLASFSSSEIYLQNSASWM